MSARNLQTALAVALLAVALGWLAYLLMRPGLTPYMAVDELLADRAALVGSDMRLAGYLAGEPQVGPGENHAFVIESGGRSLPVSCTDAVPPNLRPGDAILLDGRLGLDGTFRAHRLLTQCSSRYTDRLKRRETPPAAR